MKKVINCIIILISCIYISNINVKAECSYKERKDLLNSAKNISIVVEPIIDKVEESGDTSLDLDNNVYIVEKYSFNFIVTGLNEDLYIKYYNDFNEDNGFINFSDLTDGIYRFSNEDYSNLMTYYFEIRSNNNNCAGQKFMTKKVVKPIFNEYSRYDICSEEKLKNKDYCKKFITKNLNISEPEFFDRASDILEKPNDEKVVNDNNFWDFLTNYWYYFVGGLVIVVATIVIIAISKKRGKLV